MFFTCSHLTTSGVGRGCPGHRHATREASFKFLSSFSPLQKVPPLPGLSQSRFSTDTRVASKGLARFQLPSPAPLRLLLAQERKGKVSWGCSRKTRPWFFSRDEASMEWSGEELWGGQREKQREGGNSAR